jgi:hypothetical protein
MADLIDFLKRRDFRDRWWDLVPESTNIEDRRNEPPPSLTDTVIQRNINGRVRNPADINANTEPQRMFGLPPLGPVLGAGAKLASPLNPIGALSYFLPGAGLVPRDDAASLASRKERASKMRGAYNDFFDTPGQKAAMEDKNVTPLTPGDSYYKNTLNFRDPSVPFMSPAAKSGDPWWLDLAKQLGGMPAPAAAPAAPAAPEAPAAPAAAPVPIPQPRPPMSLAPPNPGPSSGPGVVPPMRMASAVTGNPDLPNMVDPAQLPQQGLFARTVMDPNTGGMMNDFATRSPGGDISSLFRSLIGK